MQASCAYLDDVVQVALEVVHARCDQERGAAQTRRSATGRHPVAVHALHEAQSGERDVVSALAEVELLRKARYEQARVDLGQLDAQQVGELHGQLAQARDVAGVVLNDVAQVEEHVGRALGAAHEIETGGYDLADLAAARQAALHGQLVEVESGVDAVLVEAQLAGHLVDEALAVGQRDLLGLAQAVLHAVDGDAARVVGAHELADDAHAAAAALLDLHLGDDDGLLEHVAARRAVRDAARSVHLDLVRVALLAHFDVARHSFFDFSLFLYILSLLLLLLLLFLTTAVICFCDDFLCRCRCSCVCVCV